MELSAKYTQFKANEGLPFINPLNMSYENRMPNPGVIFHSDSGIQYAIDIFRQKLKDYKIVPSMNRQGNLLDNAHVESFFHTLILLY